MKNVRFIPIEDCGLKVREAGEGQEQSRVVDGKPIIFGVRSVNLTPWSKTRIVYEILEPGCITQELIRKSDVVYNINHSTNVTDVLGRSRNGKGTLKMKLTQTGIESSCEMPHTNNANDTLELIKRGDIYGQSFAFIDDWEDTENGVSYERTGEVIDGKEVWLRHVKRIVALFDIAIVTHPAYEQTSVSAREASEAIDKAIEAQITAAEQRKAEEEAQQAEQREAPASPSTPSTGSGTAGTAGGEQEREAPAEGEQREAEEAEQKQREAEEAEQKQREAEDEAMKQRTRRLIAERRRQYIRTQIVDDIESFK